MERVQLETVLLSPSQHRHLSESLALLAQQAQEVIATYPLLNNIIVMDSHGSSLSLTSMTHPLTLLSMPPPDRVGAGRPREAPVGQREQREAHQRHRQRFCKLYVCRRCCRGSSHRTISHLVYLLVPGISARTRPRSGSTAISIVILIIPDVWSGAGELRQWRRWPGQQWLSE